MTSATAAWLTVPCAAYFGWVARGLYDTIRARRRNQHHTG